LFSALDHAKSGPVEEGNAGGGTGMRAFGFKAGTGTSSRAIIIGREHFCLGVLVQANFARRDNLMVAGVSVGKEIPDLQPIFPKELEKEGSLLVVIATDAPLLSPQLKRVVKRAALGMARTGGISTNSSGDLFIAFSTAVPAELGIREQWSTLKNNELDPLLAAAAQATEEAIINALVAARTMQGINNNTFYALPHERLREILRKYNRLLRD